MDGWEYEDECAEYLAKLGYKEIEQTVATGDQGVDIIAVLDGRRYAFQCKHYATPVGNYAVQEVYAGCAFYDCDVPVVISNTTYTRGAIELADKIGVELWPNVGGNDARASRLHRLSVLLHMILLAAVAFVIAWGCHSGTSEFIYGGCLVFAAVSLHGFVTLRHRKKRRR